MVEGTHAERNPSCDSKSVLQKNRRKSAMLYNPTACEENIVHSLVTGGDDIDSMKTVFKAAQIICKSIANFNKDCDTAHQDIQVCSDVSCVPAELYSLMRWVLTGPVQNLSTGERTSITNRFAIISLCDHFTMTPEARSWLSFLTSKGFVCRMDVHFNWRLLLPMLL